MGVFKYLGIEVNYPDLPGKTTTDPTYSGGSTPVTPGAPAASGIETVQIGEGALLARAYGEHYAAGHLVAVKHEEGPPPSVTFVMLLGEGPWDSAVKTWYASEEIAVSPDNTTPGYHFHPGTLSSGVSDPDQGIDGFLPDGITYNKSANVVVLLPEKYATEERPDKFTGRYKCLLTDNYDNTGAYVDTTYSPNPARMAADVLLKAAKLPASRIDWPSWVAWRDYCGTTITWDDGTTEHTIARFEAHGVFVGPVDVPAALSAICLMSCTRWQDDGQKIRFLLPTNLTPQHTFRPENVVLNSVRAYHLNVQDAPRHILAEFRDLIDPYLGVTSVEEKRELLIDSYGDSVSRRQYFNMNHSQAQRIAAYQMRLETDYSQRLELTAAGDSLHLLPGDCVTVALNLLHVDGLYMVAEASDNSPETTPDERQFTLQKIDGALYSDNDHHPIQREVEV